MRAMHMILIGAFLLVSVDASARVCRRNTNFPMVDKGMTLEQVTQLIGRPASAESGQGDSKVLFYCLSSSFLDTDGSDTREYWVQMMEGKVIGYGERNDVAAMQRAQRQHASAWSSAAMIVGSANQAADRLVTSGTGVITTQINVHNNTSVNVVVPVQDEPADAEDEKSDWRKWRP